MKNAILLHLHYQDLWPEFWYHLKDIKDENTHLYVTVHTTETEWYNDIKTNATEVFLIENKGMDFGGFLYAYNKIKHVDYKIIIKLHGKKRHGFYNHNLKLNLNAREWNQQLSECLIKKEKYNNLVNLFNNNKRLFYFGSKNSLLKEDKHHCWTVGIESQNIKGNQLTYNTINRILELPNLEQYEFIAGSMFAASKAYLDLFFNKKEMDLFNIMEKPPFPTNGTIAHALERLISSHAATFGGTFLCN
jgi:lipopolysaccharide biosynthesis protein